MRATRFLLTLRRDVHFSDGTPLTARRRQGVVRGVDTPGATAMPPAFARDPRRAPSSAPGRADVVGASSCAATTSSRSSSSRRSRSTRRCSPMAARRSHEAGEPATARLVGTGPSARLARADRVVVERTPATGGAGLPRLDAHRVQAGAERLRPSPRSSARARSTSRATSLPQDLDEILRDARFRQGLVEAPKKNTYFVLFNCRSGPHAARPPLRRALSGVVRPRDLVWRTLGPLRGAGHGSDPPGMPGHDAGRRAALSTREDARELLAAAGVASRSG